MIFESKYRRKALQAWEHTKEITKEEVAEQIRQKHVKYVNDLRYFLRRIKIFVHSLRFHSPNK